MLKSCALVTIRLNPQVSLSSEMSKSAPASTPNASRIASKTAEEFRFKSSASRPIREMTMLQRSLLLAEVSLISYLSVKECNLAAGKLGFVKGKFFNSNGAQAYWFQSPYDSVLVCRGTEPHEWNDIKADANAITAVAETVGRVHRGFKTEVDRLWPHVEKELETNEFPLWFCGHSLGAAMAQICAGRCLISYIKSEPEEVYTFGSPRIGNREYVEYPRLKHYRWVNNNDIVPRVPPMLLGYTHSGIELYLNHLGKIREIHGWRRVVDRARGFLSSLVKFRIDQLSDHSVTSYIDCIFEACLIEEATHKRPSAGDHPSQPANAAES